MKLFNIRYTRIRARIGRAVIAAFAAQVVAGAMCLMPASAMASPQASKGSAMPACVMDHGTAQSHTKHACPHCDAPDGIAPAHISLDHPPALAFVLVAVSQWSTIVATTPILAQPAPTGPPRSASLLLTQTQRLRI